MKNKIILAVVLSFFVSPFFAFASDFNPNYIISDVQMQDKDTMTMEAIQQFLESHDSYLKNYFDRDFYGNMTSADEIIYNAAQDYNINPQALLVMLQKEQSLIENKSPSQYNLDWAMGWHRPDGSDPNDPKLQKYSGFGIQVDGAAGLLEWYMEEHDKPGYFLRKKGVAHLIDDEQIIPANKATAALYNYTPHIHGNRNFKRIWERYFSRELLDGSIVQVEGDAGVWLIQDGVRRPFTSRSALVTRYNPNKILAISLGDLEKYPVGRPIKFAQYALLRVPDGGIFMIDGDYKRPIMSMEAFKTIGFNPEEIEDVDTEDLADYPSGDPITMSSAYPTGALLQNNQTGGVYYVADGVKHPILAREILQINFKGQTIIPVAADQLAKFEKKSPIRFDDGELLSPIDSPTVYVIENGYKRPIISGEVFESYGFSWDNIIKVPRNVLNMLHRTGPDLDFNY